MYHLHTPTLTHNSRSARALSSSSTLSLSLSTRGSAALGLGLSAGAGGSSNSGANGSNGIPAGDYAFAASTGPIDRQLLHPQHGGGGAVVGFLLHYLLQHARDTGEATYAALLEAVLATRGTLGRLPMFSRPSLSGACMAPSRLQPTRVMDDADELRNVMVLTVLLKLLPALGAPLKVRMRGCLIWCTDGSVPFFVLILTPCIRASCVCVYGQQHRSGPSGTCYSCSSTRSRTAWPSSRWRAGRCVYGGGDKDAHR